MSDMNDIKEQFNKIGLMSNSDVATSIGDGQARSLMQAASSMT